MGCKDIKSAPGSGCQWGLYCFGTICAGGPSTLGCEHLGGNVCFTCAVGLVGHNGPAWDAAEADRSIFRLLEHGRAEVISSARFKPGTLILSINGWPANAITFVDLEHWQVDAIEWIYLEPGAAELAVQTIARV